jgi:predicted amidophosphoribosyltransferase
MRISGEWREGFALDFHTLSSTYLGNGPYGHPIFDTQRSELGDLLYRLKYGGDATALPELVDTGASFVQSWNPEATIIVAAPPSRARSQQPVVLIADGLADKLGIPFAAAAVRRSRGVPELKSVHEYEERLRLLEGVHEVDAQAIQGQKVLLVDDLYRSGATMNAITKLLYGQGRAVDVCALAMTRTRSRG